MTQGIRGRKVQQRLALATVAMLCACSAAPPAPAPPAPPNAPAAPAPADASGAPAAPDAPVPLRVRFGIDVLAAGDAGVLAGKRVGLITNHTGVTSDGRSTIDVLFARDDMELVALYAPEHGIRGTAEAGAKIESGRDERTGLPIHSLYGETRKPTAAMLKDVDVLVFDIQDIGTRYYTYIWTMALALQAAAEHDKVFVVLDRPNPIGGVHTQGNILEPAQATFVGLYPVPMRHGLTVGEMARFVRAHDALEVELTVIRAEGWTRDLWYDETGLPWAPPSPNMRTLEAATHYPGTCFFEATNLSVGRGTPTAFEHVGAPWLDHDRVVARLNAIGLPGVRFESTTFTPDRPGDGMYPGEPVRGIRFITADRDVYDPTVAAIHAMVEIHKAHPQVFKIKGPGHLDRLAGNTRVREQILAGAPAAEITRGWARESAGFRERVMGLLLY